MRVQLAEARDRVADARRQPRVRHLRVVASERAAVEQRRDRDARAADGDATERGWALGFDRAHDVGDVDDFDPRLAE